MSYCPIYSVVGSPRHWRRTAPGCRPGRRAVGIPEDDVRLCPDIDVWGVILRVPVDAKTIGPAGVDGNEQNVLGQQSLANRKDHGSVSQEHASVWVREGLQHPESSWSAEGP